MTERTKSKQHHPIISCQKVNLDFKLGNNRSFTALREVSLDVYPQELVILYGPSGSGKSSLLNVIAGLERPSSGTVKIRGTDIGTYRSSELARHHRTKVGMVFQQFNLIPTLSVLENVALPQVFSNRSIASRTHRAHTLLKLFGLDTYADNTPSELSGGEQQRVAIARALANNPWILLFDEPTGNLDTKSGQDVVDLIIRLSHHSKRTILLVTHNPNYLHIADRVVHLLDGRVVKQKKQKAVRRGMHSGAQLHALSEEHMERNL